MAAKSGNIASFVFVNSAKFQKNSIKPVEEVLFSRHSCRESVKFCLFLRPRTHNSDNSCLPCLFSVVYVALASGTRISWKKRAKRSISSVLRVLERNKRGVPSNRHKQWHCDPFVSGNNAHSPLRISIARVRITYRVCSRGFLFFVGEIQVLLLFCLKSCNSFIGNRL